MKLCRFTQGGSTRIGKVVGDQVVDLSQVAGVTGSMRALLGNFPALRAALEAERGPGITLERIRLAAPIDDPQKFLAIGMNYQAHAD